MSREGGSLASRGIRDGAALISMLQSSASPLNLKNANGRIWLTRIKSGTTAEDPDPYIQSRFTDGTLVAASSITGSQGDTPAGLSPALFNHLQYNSTNNTSDRAEVTVVEVFYLYRPVTPLPEIMKNLILPGGEGLPVGVDPGLPAQAPQLDPEVLARHRAAAAAREEEITAFSLGAKNLANIRDLTGTVHFKEVEIKVQPKDGGDKSYKLFMRTYNLKEEASGLKHNGRWVIVKFEPLG